MRNFYRIFTCIALCTLFSLQVIASNEDDVKRNIVKQAKANGVDPAIVLCIAQIESGFRQNVTSSGGHIGVFQLSKHTAKHLGVNPYKTEDNIKGGILYYKKMYETFGSTELAVAAYNVGPEAIKRSNNKVPSYSRPFVNRIMSNYNQHKNYASIITN